MKIVTLGGGGSHPKIINYLKKYPVEITAVFSVADDGGSTGILRKELGVMPAGDLRRGLIGLATQAPALQTAMAYRFTQGSLKGHNLGNLILAGLEKETGSFSKAVTQLEKILGCKGHCLPVALKPVELFAQLADGTTISGETNIDVPKHNANKKITKVWLKPKVQANPAVLRAIKQADLIIYCLGDLYSSLLPIIMIKGVSEALQNTKAKKLYTCNLATKHGETNNYSAQDFVSEIEKYSGTKIDYLIYNNKPIKPALGRSLVKIDQTALASTGITCLGEDLARPDHLKIDEQKLSKVIYKLCQRLS